jgi:DNA-binding transcriptional ArsR family regulator
VYAEELRLLEDLGWSEHIECDTVDLILPRDALVGTMSRLQSDAAGSLGMYVSRPKDDEELAATRPARVVSVERPTRRARGIGQWRGGLPMTAAKPTTEDAVIRALESKDDRTAAEIADVAGLGHSTVGKTLKRLEQSGLVRRKAGRREGARRLPDRWSLAKRKHARRSTKAAEKLRPGQLDALVLDYLKAHKAEAPLGPTAVAKALGRSSGAVGNCLARLAAAGQVRQVSEHPRRYAP